MDTSASLHTTPSKGWRCPSVMNPLNGRFAAPPDWPVFAGHGSSSGTMGEAA